MQNLQFCFYKSSAPDYVITASDLTSSVSYNTAVYIPFVFGIGAISAGEFTMLVRCDLSSQPYC
jgi:hypothetical protein